MRFIKSVLCVVLAFCCLSVSAFAYTLPDTYPSTDGVSTIGVFEIAKWQNNDLDDGFNIYDFWMEVRNNPRTFIFYYPYYDSYYFFVVPDGLRVSFTHNPADPSVLIFTFVNSAGQVVSQPVKAVAFNHVGDKYIFDRVYNFRSWNSPIVLVGGSYFNEHPISGLPYDVIAEHKNGQFMIEDDLGAKPDDGGFWENLLAWLSSFWDKLRDFFVPSEGFFDDWFEEIRAAFNAKLGGLSSIFSKISSGFENMSSTPLSLKVLIPKGVFYSGFAGYEVDLVPYMQPLLNFIKPIFTAFIVIMTVVSCYKRLIEVINT